MLETLRVKNLAIVENVNVTFRDGLNVITGETGAGKSIVAGALGLVLGERADKSLVRTGEDMCGVEAVFQLPDSSGVDSVLEDAGMDPCEENRLIVRRIISTTGPGKNLVNDAPATVQTLKKIGDWLVDMHGAHDHQSLLKVECQRDILDSFGHLWKQRADYEAAFEKLEELKQRRTELERAEGEVERETDLLQYQVQEIEKAQIDEADEGDLKAEHATVGNAGRILDLACGVVRALSESDDMNAFSALAEANRELEQLERVFPEASEWREEVESICVRVQELSNTIGSRVADIDADPTRLQWLDDRLAVIHRLKKKYGGTLDEVRQSLEKAKERLKDLADLDGKLAEIDDGILEAHATVMKLGEELSKGRCAAAGALSEAITAELKDLGFSHGEFVVCIEQCEPHGSGLDRIDFGFAPNVGEAMRPLKDIASSGEISRVMLAVKSVLARHDMIPVLVFDEIDANVGGETGNAVGSKLAVLAETHQVICVTHLPQVAVHGKTHFIVSKEVKDGRTRTGVKEVSGIRRQEEVARMLGGKDLTSVTMKHAQEMLGL